MATKYVKGYGIRIFFGFAVIGCGISVVLKILSATFASIRPITDEAATVLILGVVSAISLYILIAFLKGVHEERAQRSERKQQIVHA